MEKIQESCLLIIKSWVSEYIARFYSEKSEIQSAIRMKEDHIKRVVYEILDIANSLNLTTDECYLAEILALLHDIGRFEQYTRYKTFHDGKSVNHAQLSEEIIIYENVLEQFSDGLRDLILNIVAQHNTALPYKSGNSDYNFFIKLLRDADKVDILNVVTSYYFFKYKSHSKIIELGFPDTAGISNEIFNDVSNGRIASVQHLANLNDLKVLQMGWIFDIHFPRTFQKIKKHKYLEKIYSSINNSCKADEIFNVTKRYLERNLKDVRSTDAIWQ